MVLLGLPGVYPTVVSYYIIIFYISVIQFSFTVLTYLVVPLGGVGTRNHANYFVNRGFVEQDAESERGSSIAE